MISKTKLSKRILKKRNQEIVETLMLAKKMQAWNKIAQSISGSRRNYASVNLKEIEEKTSEGDTVVVMGKVLGNGDVSKKIRVCSLGFSESAKKKLELKKGEAVTILNEMQINPKAEGVKVLQ